jgi:hypothetical protein
MTALDKCDRLVRVELCFLCEAQVRDDQRVRSSGVVRPVAGTRPRLLDR